jgi:hypothetical protein
MERDCGATRKTKKSVKTASGAYPNWTVKQAEVAFRAPVKQSAQLTHMHNCP